ncbi:hypothetical protein C3747_14g88 [Trypanosoma cruzi]|uniref:Uncharacterized protein n=2 Tax=Trypanosoma cruzi TaxID=5693 RepID=Q4E604_TRYCC|nr:hypothetical protein, conserved [Trypanosoma cruzi]EAO00285.1 hypothetical protein, conserved [Trypanosoma cruzi]PWV18207.1 hypothetical protein C3747_14g88 [Trypanosoma cruzi]RNC48898.1 hypothetical protein TcCL_NonESM01173 [Trypanosoma cruzi]|eukprot:XP_822136.1 hypothetical protein [Trypanosoma cruzi strain CL Brener]
MRASPRLSASFSSSAISSTPTAVAAAASSSSLDGTLQEVERCFLRHVIPMRVQGAGSAAALYRHAFLHQESLIQRVLGALESVPLPALPRMLLAEGFQRMLDGETPQRDIRALFEEAENEARRVLIQAESHSSVNSQHCDGHFYAAIKTNPLMRLLAYELRAACGYYAQIMSIRSQPEDGAAMLLRTLIAADIRTDPFLVDVMLKFAALRRNVDTGERLEACPSPVEEFVKECLLLERDAFGRFRFDARGDNRHLLHCIKLSDITRAPRDFAVLLDPVLRQHGNFCIQSTSVHQGRWMEHRLSCAEESHRVDPHLPLLETVEVPSNKESELSVGDAVGVAHGVSGRPPLVFFVRYNDPMCRRHKETTREKGAEKDHLEVFELAVEDKSRTFWEKWFMDR